MVLIRGFLRLVALGACVLVLDGCYGDGAGAVVWISSRDTNAHYIVLRGAGPREDSREQFQVTVLAGEWRADSIHFTSLRSGEVIVYDRQCQLEADFTISFGDFTVSIDNTRQPTISNASGSHDAARLPSDTITCGQWASP